MVAYETWTKCILSKISVIWIGTWNKVYQKAFIIHNIKLKRDMYFNHPMTSISCDITRKCDSTSYVGLSMAAHSNTTIPPHILSFLIAAFTRLNHLVKDITLLTPSNKQKCQLLLTVTWRFLIFRRDFPWDNCNSTVTSAIAMSLPLSYNLTDAISSIPF